MAEPMTIGKRRDDIDGLRAVALFFVMLYHAAFGLTRGLFIGVDMFFFISGYFIAHGLLRDLDGGRFSLGGFYLRRLWRIVPPLAVVALCCIVPAYLWFTPPDLIQFGKTLLSVLTFVSNYFFYSQGGYFDAPLESNPFLPTWFLSVQVQFYLVFPLLIYFFHRRFPKRLPAFVLALLTGSLVLSQISVSVYPKAAYFMLYSRFWELVLGSLVAILQLRGTLRRVSLPGWAAECLGWGAVAVVVACGLRYTPNTPFPGLTALPVCLGTAILVVLPLVARRPPSVSVLLGLRPLAFIGVISYSVYLWHWPIFVYLKEYLMVHLLSVRMRFFAILCSLVVGLLSWFLLERGLGNVKGLGKRWKAGIMLVPVCVAAVFLAVASATSGLPNRFPPEAQPYIDVLAEMHEAAVTGDAVQVHDIAPETIEKVDIDDAGVYALGKGDGAKPTFLVWGDSHAYHIGALFEHIADELSIDGLLFTSSGFPPLLGAYRPYNDATQAKRESRMKLMRAAAEMVRLKRIPVVLLVGYWRLYPERDLTASLPDGKTLAGYAAFELGLDNMVASLEEMGCEVWILRSIPSFPLSIPLMAMRTLQRGGDPRRVRFGVEEHNKKEAEVNGVLDEIARRHPSVKFIDPVPALCPDGACRFEVDNLPLYFDDNHLSKRGALYLEPAFADFIASLKKHAR